MFDINTSLLNFPIELKKRSKVTGFRRWSIKESLSFKKYTRDNFEMGDGAYLNLASGIIADRNQNKFGGKIKPAVETKDKESALKDATKWILEKR